MGTSARQDNAPDGLLSQHYRRVYICADDYEILRGMAAQGFRPMTQQLSKIIREANNKESNDGNPA